MSATTRFFRKHREKQNKEKQTKLQRIVNNIGIFGLFTTIALLILGIFQIYKLSSFMFGLIATIAIVSFCCFLIIPWLKTFEKGQYKKTSLTFMILVVICSILWLICVYLGINLYEQSKLVIKNNSSLSFTLKLMKITTILSLQILVASGIANTFIRYKKEMIVFQVISYASELFFDFYTTSLLLCLTIDPVDGLQISKNIKFLFTKIMIVLFILSVIYMMLSSKIMQMIDARRFKDAVNDYNEGLEQPNQDQPSETNKSSNSMEERLEKLQSMLDKKLITQEEFDEKRKEILKDI